MTSLQPYWCSKKHKTAAMLVSQQSLYRSGDLQMQRSTDPAIYRSIDLPITRSTDPAISRSSDL